MTDLVEMELSTVTELRVLENVFRWQATNMFSSRNIRPFTSRAIAIKCGKKGTFSIHGSLAYDAQYGTDTRKLSFYIQRNDDEISRIRKECGLQVSVTAYNKNDVEKFNHIKNISWTDLLQKKSVEIFPSMTLSSNHGQEYPENLIILEATVKQNCDDLKLSQASVLKDIKSMYETKEFADFKIQVKNREFLAHKVILCRSKVFRGMLRANMEETKKNEVDFKDVATEEQLLLFMYTGEISSREKAALELADLAERFALIELRRFCEDYVEETIHLDNAVTVFTYADLRDRDSLKKTAVDFIVKNKDKFKDADLQPVFENPNFCKMVVRNNCK